MNLFGKSKKTKKSECRIREKIEHSNDKYTVATLDSGRGYGYGFSVTEIAHLYDGHFSSLNGKGKSKDFYLPMNPYGKPDSSMVTRDFEFKIVSVSNPRSHVEQVVKNKYKLDEEKLANDYLTHLHDKGVATISLHDNYNLSLYLEINEELFQKIYSAIKDNQPVSKIEFQLMFFSLYRSDSDSKDFGAFYLEERTSDTSYQSLGLFEKLIIETHKTIIP